MAAVDALPPPPAQAAGKPTVKQIDREKVRSSMWIIHTTENLIMQSATMQALACNRVDSANAPAENESRERA